MQPPEAENSNLIGKKKLKTLSYSWFFPKMKFINISPLLCPSVFGLVAQIWSQQNDPVKHNVFLNLIGHGDVALTTVQCLLNTTFPPCPIIQWFYFDYFSNSVHDNVHFKPGLKFDDTRALNNQPYSRK